MTEEIQHLKIVFENLYKLTYKDNEALLWDEMKVLIEKLK